MSSFLPPSAGGPQPPQTVEFPWTYGRDPAGDPADAVRLLIGDTDPNAKLLSDAEVAFFLADNSNNPLAASVRAIEAVMAAAVAFVDETVGSVSIQFSQRLDHLGTIRAMLMDRMGSYEGVPYCGGISVADRQQQRANVDRVRPQFTTRQGDAPGLFGRPYWGLRASVLGETNAADDVWSPE